MTDYKYILRNAFKGSIAVLAFLAVVQPFGIGKLNEGRVGCILMHSFLTFFSALFSLLVARVILGDYEKRHSLQRSFLVFQTIAYIVNMPVLAFLLLAFDGWFFMGRWELYFYIEDISR